MIIEADSLTTTWEVAKEVNVQHSGLLAFEANWKGEKAHKWVPNELTANQKNYCFEVSSSSYSAQQRTISQSDCDVWWKIDFIQLAVTSSVAGPRSSALESKHFPKPKLHPKKVMVNVWWSAAHLIHYSFLNPSKTITFEKYAQQIDEMHWQLHCLQPATERAQFVPWQCLTARHKTNASKVEWMGPWSFASSAIFTWPLTNQLPPLQTSRKFFAGKMLPQLAGGRKCFPRVHWILRHGF